MYDNQPARPAARHWRPITAAVLTAIAAAVTTFACLAGPSSAAPVSDQSHIAGLNDRVPAGLQGAVGADIGQPWWAGLSTAAPSGR
jgi:hypothetical protein